MPAPARSRAHLSAVRRTQTLTISVRYQPSRACRREVRFARHSPRRCRSRADRRVDDPGASASISENGCGVWQRRRPRPQSAQAAVSGSSCTTAANPRMDGPWRTACGFSYTAPARSGEGLGHGRGGELAGIERGVVEAEEKVSDRDRPAAVQADHLDMASMRATWPADRRVSASATTPSDGRGIPDADVAASPNVRDRTGRHSDERIEFILPIRCQGADRNDDASCSTSRSPSMPPMPTSTSARSVLVGA